MTKKMATNKSDKSVKHLKVVLADTFVLYMKTYAVHWNFQGPKFFSVHKMTEMQYQELAEAIDEVAERIRACGNEAPISLQDILGSTDLKEMSRLHAASSDGGIADLAQTHLQLSKRAKEAIAAMEEENDVFSADMMTARVGAHEKAAWMLKSIL